MSVADPRLGIMGGGTQQANLAEVRQRAIELQNSINSVIHSLRTSPGAIKWDDMLKTYQVINTQLASLREALRPPILDGLALLPRSVPDPAFGEAVTVQLSVTLTPEGQAAAAAAASAVEAALGLTSDMPSMAMFAVLNNHMEAYNNVLLASLVGPPRPAPTQGDPPILSLLDPRAQLRTEIQGIKQATRVRLDMQAKIDDAVRQSLAAAARGMPPASTVAARTAGAGATAQQAAKKRRETMDPALLLLLTGERASK